jgi:hypothetical protein
MESKTIKVLVVKPEETPVVETIEASLESYQKIVGGYIEVIYPFDDPVALICNEEGKIDGLPLNRAMYDESGNVWDIIAGTFLIVGADPSEEDFGGLNEELIDKYKRRFWATETFLGVNGEIRVIRFVDTEG